MKIAELLLDYVAALNFRKWISFVVMLVTVTTAIWILDSYTGYSRLYRIERAIGLVERVDTLERKGAGSAEVDAVRKAILKETAAMLSDNQTHDIGPNVSPWYGKPWAKLISGSLPWFLVSVALIPGVWNKERNSLEGFISLQLFTVFFAFVNYWVPSYGRFWIDHIIVPWGIFFVCVVIPISITGVSAFRRVKDASIQKAITNNLRQLSSAAQQFYMESGQTEVPYENLVGPSSKYIKEIRPVDGERYDLIEFKFGQPLVVYRRSGEPVRLEA